MGVIFGQFFFCLVCRLACYSPSRKKVRKIIHGEGGGEVGVGTTWGHNFYMGTQNGSKLEISPWGILIDAFD